MQTALNPGVKKREVFAWAMYDFANSGYTTVVLTAIFSTFFVSVVANGAEWATFAWTATLSVSYLAVMIVGPLVGSYADARARKKPLLAYATAGCVLATALLYFAGPGTFTLAIVCVIVSNFCYAIGENLNAAFLPELARPEAIGKVSGWGWAWGYVGGLVALGLCLWWIQAGKAAGQSGATLVPMTLIITAALYAAGACITFLWLKERGVPRSDRDGEFTSITRMFTTLTASLREAQQYRDLWRVFLCGTCYQAGVATVIALAAIYAQEAMGFQTEETLKLILVVNVTACIGAFGFGYVQDRIGKKRALGLTLFGWLIMILVAWLATTKPLFWVAANLAGLCMGSSQSAGRALVAYLSPPTRSAEMFGLFGVATRLAAVLGPLTYGIVTWVTQNNHRLAMLVTGVFFVAALWVLRGVDENRGRATALGNF